MRILCCFEVGWVSKIWGVTFFVVPPKDKFALEESDVSNYESFEPSKETYQEIVLCLIKIFF
jgi:hypothetical protein